MSSAPVLELRAFRQLVGQSRISLPRPVARNAGFRQRQYVRLSLQGADREPHLSPLVEILGAATILRSPETKEKDKSADDKKPARAWTLWPNVAEQGVGNKTSTASQSEKINPATPEDTAEVERDSFHGQITVFRRAIRN